MTQELKDRWTTALRSGTYQQGCGTARRGDRFNAIGVLFDVIDSNGWRADNYGNDHGRWCGVDLWLAFDTVRDLIRLNDDECRTFAAIADWIEENVKVAP